MPHPTSHTDRLALLLTGCTVSLPFLQPLHSTPITSFYSEWLAIVLGLLTALAATLGGNPRLPRTTVMPALFLGLIAIQGVQGLVLNRGLALIASGYLLWAGILMAISTTLGERVGRERVAGVLAGGLLAAALANALLSLASMAGVHSIWITPQPGYAAFGNIGQKNHLAQLLWLGIASAGYLFHRRQLTAPILAVSLLLLMSVSLLTGARATLLYALGCGLLLWIYGYRRAGASIAGLYVTALILLPKLITLDPGANAADRISAAFASIQSGATLVDARTQVLGEAWRMFISAPLTGIGIGNFSWRAFLDQEAIAARFATGEHAHNLFAHVAAEFGLLGLTAVATGLLLGLMPLLRDGRRPMHGWMIACIGIGLIHAQLEYPLWYAYFLAVFALLLGLSPQRSYGIRLPRWIWVGVLSITLLVCINLGRDYLMLEAASRSAPTAVSEAQFRNRIQVLAALSRYSLLGAHADRALVASSAPVADGLTEKRALCRSSLPTLPSSTGVFHCALFEEIAGCRRNAEHLWRLGSRSFPADRDMTINALQTGLNAEEIKPLLALISAAAAPPAAPDPRADCRFPGL